MKKCPECGCKEFEPDIISGMVAVSEDDQQVNEYQIMACQGENCDYYY